MRLDVTDIIDGDWLALDDFLDRVEDGELSEGELFNYETFLHMLAAVKYDADNFEAIPSFIRIKKLTIKYCQQVNPDVIEILNGNSLSKVDIYKKYLGVFYDENSEKCEIV